MTLEAFNKMLPHFPWRWGECIVNWPKTESRPDPMWVKTLGSCQPLPGRVMAAMDLEPAKVGSILVPKTGRYWETGGDCRSPLQANAGTVAESGVFWLEPGDRIVVRPYHGARFEEFRGCREVAFFGVPCFAELEEDVIAYQPPSQEWMLVGDWVCARPMPAPETVLVRDGNYLDSWEILGAGPEAEVVPGQTAAFARYDCAQDDATMLWCSDSPWGKNVVFLREYDERRRLRTLCVIE